MALLNEAKSAMSLSTSRPDGFHSEFLDRAAKAYQTLVDSYPDRMPVVATALAGLASIEESRFVIDGDLKHRDIAKGFLERLQNGTAFKGTPFQTEAARRLKSLASTFQAITLADPLPLPPLPQLPASSSADDTTAKTEAQPTTPPSDGANSKPDAKDNAPNGAGAKKDALDSPGAKADTPPAGQPSPK